MKLRYITKSIAINFLLLGSLHGSAQQEIKKNAQKIVLPQRGPVRALLIFLDDAEDKLDYVSGELLTALAQKACPILASRYNFTMALGKPHIVDLKMEWAKTNEQGIPAAMVQQYEQIKKELAAAQTTDQTVLLAQLNKNFPESPQDAEEPREPALQEAIDAVEKAMIVDALAFNPDEWIIRASDYLVLLVPRAYLEKSLTDYKPKTSPELALGLKIERKTERMVPFVEKPVKKLAAEPYQYFIKSLPDIFVTTAEYASQGEETPAPEWVIYLSGHGTLGNPAGHGTLPDSTAQLPHDQFKQWLDFLGNKLYTKLLAYSACFATGVNEKKIYGELEKNVTKTFPFAIAICGTTDEMAMVDSPRVPLSHFTADDIDVKAKKVRIKASNKFDQFVEKMSQGGAADFDAVNLILPSQPDFPQPILLKLPGTDWFNVADSSCTTISITNVMAKARTTPLNITTFAQSRAPVKAPGIKPCIANPQTILLYSPTVPFEIIVDTKTMPMIASMLPGNAVHALEELTITSKELSWINIRDGFLMNVRDLAARKIFWVSQINKAAITDEDFWKETTLYDFVIDIRPQTFTATNETVEHFITCNTNEEGEIDCFAWPEDDEALQQEVEKLRENGYEDAYADLKNSLPESVEIKKWRENLPSLEAAQQKKLEKMRGGEKETKEAKQEYKKIGGKWVKQ